jgi:hypothetical protein
VSNRQTVTLPVADVRDLIAAARNAALTVGCIADITDARKGLFSTVRVIEAQIGLQAAYPQPGADMDIPPVPPAALVLPRVSAWRVALARVRLALRRMDATLFGPAEHA